MKLPQVNVCKHKNLMLAFAVPFGMLLAMMFVTSVTPFGDYTMLYSDMFHQYYPFFRAFRDALRSGESLLWNWSAGMGMDYLGLISYYLASPLNLLSVLVPDSFVLSYFTLLVPIKLGIAGFAFAYMVKKLYGKDDLSLVFFGTLYALCAWALGYQWNIMWVDCFALLPLVCLGTILLLRDRKYKLYTIMLFLTVFSNYYAGFFVCIFVFLLFFCYEICRFRSVGRFCLDFLRIGFFTVLALGMTMLLELPALAALQNTQSSVNQFPEGFAVNMVSGEAVNAAKEAWKLFKEAKETGSQTFGLWWDAIKLSFPPLTQAMAMVAGQMGGGQGLTHIDGLPNLYCGVLSVALSFCFLLSGKVKLRDKLCSVVLLLLFAFSFIIRQLDYIWHGFHFPNQIPYRFSFLFSFVVLYMAYRAWLLRDQLKIWQILGAGLLSAGIFLADGDKLKDPAYLMFNFALLGLYLVAMLYGNENLLPVPKPQQTEEGQELQEQPKSLLPSPELRQRQSAAVIAVVLTVEMILNLVGFASGFGIYEYDYPKNGDATASMLQVMRDQENGESLFYRVEMTHAQTLNDGPLNGYNGITTFTSSANVAVTKFMQSMGFGAWDTYNRYCYEDASPVANLFLNIKYMLEREFPYGENAYFEKLHTYEKVILLENKAYLPLGFLAEKGLEELPFTTNSNIPFQNKLFTAATGLEGDVWALLGDQDTRVTGQDVTLKVSNVSGYTSFSTGAKAGKLTYQYSITRSGFLLLDMNLYKQKNFTVWHNGVRLYSESYSLPQTFAVCNVKPGDEVKVIVECGANQNSTSVSIRAALLQDRLFQRGYEILKASTLELTDFSTTYMAGTIDCNRDGLLYASIPQDGNWLAYVDGEQVETTLVGGAMLALPMTKGAHTVEFRYENEAFETGLAISLSCAAVFAAICLGEWYYKKKKKS